jgi:hypothetical protein
MNAEADQEEVKKLTATALKAVEQSRTILKDWKASNEKFGSELAAVRSLLSTPGCSLGPRRSIRLSTKKLGGLRTSKLFTVLVVHTDPRVLQRL